MKKLLTLAAAFCAGLCVPARAQITHQVWNGSQDESWMGFAIDSIGVKSARRLLVAQPLYDHLIGVGGIDVMAGVVRVYDGKNADGPPLFSVYGGFKQMLGRSVAGVGDLNGDLYEDFAAGSGYASASALFQEGVVWVFSGKDGAKLFTLTGPQDQSLFGEAVAGPGDVNGDGTPDILVGAPNYDFAGGGQNHGRVYVFSGVNGSLLQVFTGNSDSNLGSAVCGVGDVDGDGRADFAAGAAGDDTFGFQAGRVAVVRGGVGGVWKNLYGDSAGDDFGASIAGGGDADGDGVDDFIVGAPGDVSDRGMVAVFKGPSFNTLYKQVISLAVNDHLGKSVDFAGDVDKDGFDDFVMGAPGVSGVGKVSCRSGKTGATIGTSMLGAAAGDSFGENVAGVGDANGDGWDDVLIGAPFSDVIDYNGGTVKLVGWQVAQPDVGGGGVGSTQLAVFGAALTTGYGATLAVTNGPASAPTWLMVSATSLPLAFMGGTLIPNINTAFFVSLPLNAAGKISVPVPGGGGPFSLYVQDIVQDAAQPNGVQLTHCVRIDFLP